MAKSSCRRIVHVGILIEATHADDPALLGCEEEDFAGAVETVHAGIPLLPGASYEGVAFDCGHLLQGM